MKSANVIMLICKNKQVYNSHVSIAGGFVRQLLENVLILMQ
jgi:hypothetical protein